MTTLQLGAVTVDLEQRVALRGGEPVPLARKESDILLYLAARPNTDVPREELYEQVWGYRPTVVSRTLDTTVHRLRTKIEDNPSDPAFLRTVHGFGYRLVYAALGTPRQPNAPESLLGRDVELATLAASQGPLLVHGPPGMGKTALLARAAAGIPEAAWIDAAALSDADMAAALASSDAPVVVLDGLEAVGSALRSALSRDARPILLGARSAAGWSGARLRVGPLPLPAACQLLVTELASQSFPLPDPGELRTLVEAVDRVPALVIAVSRAIPAIGVGSLTKRLRTGSVALEGPLCQRMQGIVEEDWSHLVQAQRTLLAQAVLFGADASLDAIEAMLVGDDPQVVGRISELFERGWLAPAERDGRVRLYWHMRACVHRVASEADRRRAKERLVAWGLVEARALVQRADPDEGAEPSLIRDLGRVLTQCDAVADRSVVLLALDRLYSAAGSSYDHRELLDQALAAQDLHPDIEIALRLSRSRLGLHTLDPTVEIDVAAVLESLGTSASDPRAQHAFGILALYRQYQGRTAAADECLAQAVEYAGQVDALIGILNYGAGQVYHARGDIDRAELAFREAHERAVRAADVSLSRQALVKLAVTLTDALRLGAASAALAQVARTRAGGSAGRFGASVAMLEGQIALLRGDRCTAQQAYCTARSICDDMGLDGGAAAAETSLAWLSLAEGDAETALQLGVHALDRWPRHRNPLRLGATRVALAVTHLLMGEGWTALELFEEARRDFRGDPRHAALSEVFHALAFAGSGAFEEAVETLMRARRWFDEHPDRLGGSLLRRVAILLDPADASPESSVPEPYAAVLQRLESVLGDVTNVTLS